MSILIRKAGLLTTVQDLGRAGYRRFGINPNGVMDRTATRIINVLLGNDEHEAVLEMHFPAAEIVFESPCVFALGGADLEPHLDGRPIAIWRTYHAEAGSVLSFSGKRLGSRVYLAVRGGFDVEEWLGSRSTNLAASIGGFSGRALKTGDRIGLRQADPTDPVVGRTVSPSMVPRYSRFPTVRVIAGAEYHLLTEKSRHDLAAGNFAVTNRSDRMGFRLSGEPLALSEPLELVSAAVTFGTIQLLPDGQMILLMADHQASGGYPRIAHVIERDLAIAGQLSGGDSIAFHKIELNDAEMLAAELDTDLAILKTGVAMTKL